MVTGQEAHNSIWIDLDNSPHVPLFLPIISRYRERGVSVIVTARDHSQTVELLRQGLGDEEFNVIGRHYGASTAAKLFGTLMRAFKLARFIRRGVKPRVAVSHGSRSMVIAARLLRIPVLTMYDYEFTETRIFNRFSTRVLVPEGVPDEVLDEIGLADKKRVKYAGIKEELYMRTFAPDPDFADVLEKSLGSAVPENVIRVLLRPPATTANYHDANSDELFDSLINMLRGRTDVFTIIVPRTREQGADIRSRLGEVETSIVILERPVNGLDLIAASDVVISGGGTMNREAVLAGVPVYSIFRGRQGALDRSMEASGDIVFIRSPDELDRIAFTKRPDRLQRHSPKELSDRVERKLVDNIDFFLDGPRNGG